MNVMSEKVIKKAKRSRSVEEKVCSGGDSRVKGSILRDLGGVVNRKILDAGAQADEILAEARAQAELIRNEAQQMLSEVEEIRERARVEGYAEGKTEGEASVTTMMMELASLREQFYDTAEPEVIKLVGQIAEKVMGKLAKEHGQLIKAVVRQAIEAAIGDRIVVRVNPEDFVLLQADDTELRELLDRTKRLHFKEDDSISQGGCIVETEVGTIDAQLETQLRAIRKALEL